MHLRGAEGPSLSQGACRVLVSRDCFGGGRIVDIELPRPVVRADLERIAGAETREMLEGLPKPFYRVDVPGRFLVSGLLDDARVRFTVRLAMKERAVDLALAEAARMLG